MRIRHKIAAIAGVLVLAFSIAFLSRTPAGVSLTFVGYEGTSTNKVWFVVTNDSPRRIRISADPIEFRNEHGWLFLGAVINFSTGQVIDVEHEMAAGETFRFSVTEPTERLPWRASLRWCTPYKKQWWKVQYFVDGCFRRMRVTAPFSRSGILKGPEAPNKPPNEQG